MKVSGKFAVAGGLVDAIILPSGPKRPGLDETAEVRGRVERVDGDLTAVRFSNVTAFVAKLIDGK